MATQIWVELPEVTGGGGGSVNSVTASAPLTSSLGTDPNISFVNEVKNTVLAGPTTGANASPTFRALVASDLGTFSTNTFAGFDNSGHLESVPGFSISNTGGMNINLTEQPNNGGGFSLNDEVYSFDPLQNSPNEDWNIYNIGINFDINNSGFSQGTSGNAVQLFNMGFNHQNTGPIGQVVFENLTGNFGNGSDPLTTGGLFGIGMGVTYNANVTLNNPLNGFNFNVNVNASAIKGTNLGVTAYSDNSQIAIPIDTYFGSNLSPNLSEISNNANFNGVFVGPNITTLTGNASAAGFSFNGAFTNTSTTGGIVGFFANPTITTMGATGYYHGLDIYGNITTSHGNVQGININTNINGGDANYTGMNINPGGGSTLPQLQGLNINLSNVNSTTQKIGIQVNDGSFQSNANYDTSVLPASPGFVALNNLGGTYTVASGSPVTNTLVFANNIALGSLFQDDMGPDAFGGFLGYVALAEANQISVAIGKTVDTVNSFVGGFSVPSIAGDGGTITNATIYNCLGVVPGGGSLTVTNLYGFRVFTPFPTLATNAWAFIDESGSENFVSKLSIGTSSLKVSNSDTALEIGNKKAFLPGQVTTVEKLALTALEGMVVYDTTLHQLSYYNGTTWINL